MWMSMISAWWCARSSRIAERDTPAPIWDSRKRSASPRIRDVHWNIGLALTRALIAGASCSGTCETLASNICACQPNQTEEAQCLQTVNNSTKEPTDLDNERCDALLDSCTCDALEKNDLAACGLARKEPNQ